MKNILGIIVIAAIIVLGLNSAFDENNPLQGRGIALLIIAIILPLILAGTVVYDATKIRKEKNATWRKAFSQALNRPPKS